VTSSHLLCSMTSSIISSRPASRCTANLNLPVPQLIITYLLDCQSPFTFKSKVHLVFYVNLFRGLILSVTISCFSMCAHLE